MNLGYAIKLIRKELELTQVELSERAGVSQTSLSQIENGGKRPSQRTLTKVCRAMDIPESLLYILGMDESEVPESRREIFQLIFPAIKSLAMQIVESEHEELAMAG